jgi:hypothetical protein
MIKDFFCIEGMPFTLLRTWRAILFKDHAQHLLSLMYVVTSIIKTTTPIVVVLPTL